jgi:hypothetical protein
MNRFATNLAVIAVAVTACFDAGNDSRADSPDGPRVTQAAPVQEVPSQHESAKRTEGKAPTGAASITPPEIASPARPAVGKTAGGSSCPCGPDCQCAAEAYDRGYRDGKAEAAGEYAKGYREGLLAAKGQFEKTIEPRAPPSPPPALKITYLSTPTCGPCRRFEKQVLADPEVTAAMAAHELSKGHPEDFGVGLVPALRVEHPDGRVQTYSPVPINKQFLLGLLRDKSVVR